MKVISTLCATLTSHLDGYDPEGLFPVGAGPKATAVVESVGEGVTSVKLGTT